MKKIEQVKITSLDVVPEVVNKEFRFLQDGKEYILEYMPLTAEQVEEIRASIPAPIPPLKPLRGFTTKEMSFRKSQGLPLVGPDTDDPDYVVADKKYQRDVALEMVRTALGWDVPHEDFAKIMRTRLTQGVYSRLMSDITQATFQIDSSLIESFLGTLAQQIETDEASTLSTESSPAIPTAG